MTNDNDFIKKVSELFIENGAKSLTMDEVAREFGMSKKTLYQRYANKDALLEEVLRYKLEEVITRFRELDEAMENAIDRMLCRDPELEKATTTNRSILLKQLIKYYPHIFERHMQSFSDSFAETMAHNIRKGRAQGLYREDFDADSYARLFFQMVISYDSSPFMEGSGIDREHYMQAAMDMYLSAITNERGKAYLNNIKKEI